MFPHTLCLDWSDSLRSKHSLDCDNHTANEIVIHRVATGVTFKQAKGDLAKKGWNPRQDCGGDVLYWLDGKKYRKLEEQSWAEIESGKAKL